MNPSEKIQVHTRIDYWYVIAEQHAVWELHHYNCKQDANTKATQKLMDKKPRGYESTKKQHFIETHLAL